MFEKIFFWWSTTRPMEAFEFRHDMVEALVNSNEGDTRNAGYVHRVIGGQLAKRDTPQAVALALELGLSGPFDAFIQGIVGRGQFPGLANMTSVVRKVPADHWVRGNVFSWIKEHEASEDVLPWASTNLSPADHKALSILYELPPEPANSDSVERASLP